MKCDGTPRHACSEMSAVSATHRNANTPRMRLRERSFIGIHDATQTMVTSVRPNDTPKAEGFRSDNGPCHEPPVATEDGGVGDAPQKQREPDRVAEPFNGA